MVVSIGSFTKSVVEDAALAWLEALGYAFRHGLEVAAGEPTAEPSVPGCRDVMLERSLHGTPSPTLTCGESKVLRAGNLSERIA